MTLIYPRQYLSRTKASGAELIHETNNSNKHNVIKIPTGRRQTIWLFTRMTEDLNQNNTS